MFNKLSNSTRMAVSSVAAVAVVSFSALALDRGHIAAAPAGTVEIGELSLATGQPQVAALPEVQVRASRLAPERSRLAAVELPEIFVVAERPAQRIARSGYKTAPGSKAAGASGAGALLK